MIDEDTLFPAVLAKLAEGHAAFPEMRIGLMLQGAIDMKKRTINFNLNDLSTKELYTALDAFIEAHKKKRGVQ